MEKIRPIKRLGQHFLKDENYLRKIADAAELTPSEACLEIGPGTGTLTRHLLKRAGKVVAVEIDRRLVSVLQNIQDENLLVIQGDFLKTDLKALATGFPGEWKVAANLPYLISSQAIFHLLENIGLFKGIFLLVQKEFARRVAAGPGSKDYGIPSILCQMDTECKLLFSVPKTVFDPPPEVESALLSMIPREKPLYNCGDREIFRAIVRAAFEHRRKTCYNSLRIAFRKGYCGVSALRTLSDENLSSALEAGGVSPEARPENLTIAQFAAISLYLTGELEERNRLPR